MKIEIPMPDWDILTEKMAGLLLVIFLLLIAWVWFLINGSRINYSQEINDRTLTCKYVGARTTFVREYWYAENNFMGKDSCPFLLHQNE